MSCLWSSDCIYVRLLGQFVFMLHSAHYSLLRHTFGESMQRACFGRLKSMQSQHKCDMAIT